jgi:hypothetical protein
MNMTFENVCAVLHAAQIGGKWMALCPAHDDHTPSLSIDRGDTQSVIFKCFAGCSQEVVLAKVNTLLGAPVKVSAPQQVDSENWGYSMERLAHAEVLLSKAADFLAARGISLEVARASHCGFDNGYLVIPTFWHGELVAVKLRNIASTCAPEKKWKKFRRYQKSFFLFNADAARGDDLTFADDLYILESELDALTAASHGYRAVSVDSANHTLSESDIALLKKFPGTLILAPDNDTAGLSCAVRLTTQLGMDATRSIRFPNKDLGDLYQADPAKFSESLDTLRSAAIPLWRQKFHVLKELAEGEPRQLVKQILPEGITFFGSLSGVCKTWFALALAKSLVTGEKFLDVFDVTEKRSVLYLCPEMGERAIRARGVKLHLPMDDGFYCQTISDGAIALNDPLLFQAVRDLNGPVIFLDTAIRFSGAESENDSRENAGGLAMLAFALLRAGAIAVVCLHHSKKAQGEANFMTLENVLRGTGDFGAMADCVWGLQHARKRKGNSQWDEDYQQESKTLTRVYIECVKPRDLPAADPFIVQGRPFIDDLGKIVVIARDAQVGEAMDAEKVSESATAKAEQFVRQNPKASKSQVAKISGISRNRIEEALAGRGITWKATSETSGQWSIEDGLSGMAAGEDDENGF